MLDASPRWASHHWPDGSVFYDRQTGATHALSPLAAEVLALPDVARYDAAQAAEAIATALSLPCSPELTDNVTQALDQLRRIELI